MTSRIRTALTMTLAASAVAAMSLGAAASASAKDTGLVVTQLPAQVRLVAGESIVLSLSTNVTTGYSWAPKVSGDAKTVKVGKGVYEPAPPTSGMVGVPGTTKWAISATKPGKAVITIVATPPGGGAGVTTNADGAQQKLTIIVMKGK
jgi:predicted secreted protein